MARKKYDDQTKAAALGALLEGQAISHVAKEYKIPYGTLRSWKTRELKGVYASDMEEKQARLGPLLIDYMETSLKAMTSQMKVMADETWLKRQTAESLGVLHGIQMDKLMRLLEAFENAESGD